MWIWQFEFQWSMEKLLLLKVNIIFIVIFISIPGKQHKRTKGQKVKLFSLISKSWKQAMAESAVLVVEELKCSICLDNFNNPKVLPCCHSFCLHCLEGAHERTKDKKSLTCPQCKAQHQVNDLKRRYVYKICLCKVCVHAIPLRTCTAWQD